MDAAAATAVAREFLGGICDVLGALTDAPVETSLEAPAVAEAGTIQERLDGPSVSILAELNNGNSVGALFLVADVAGILAISDDGAEPKTELTPDDLAAFEETARAMLSAGVARWARVVENELTLESVRVEAAGDFASAIEACGPCSAVHFRFQCPPRFDSSAAVLIPESFEGDVPSSLIEGLDTDDLGPENLVSDEEIMDILSGLDPGQEELPGSEPDGLSSSGNLDVILDIELLVMVRLGRVEMPLAEVLRLGPGSIIEVGQLVDEPVELLVNGRLIARGDVVVVDERFGLRVTEVISRKERIESLR